MMRFKKCGLVVFFLLPLLTAFTQEVFHPVKAEDVRGLLERSAVKGKHPRLFYSTEDLDRVKLLYASGDPIARLSVNGYRKDVKAILKQPLLTYHLDEAKLRVPSVHRFAGQVPALMMAWQLDGDTAAAGRLIRQLELMVAYPDWGADRHFLDAGIGAFDFAMIYDGLYKVLTEEQRKKFRNGIRRLVLEPGLAQLRRRIWWSTADHNWNGICNGGLIMASLAMYEEAPELTSEIIALATNALPKYIHAFEPDGQSEEGLMYWSYGLMYTTIAFESMQRVLGTRFQLDQFPGFRKTGWFPAFVSGPVTSLNIGDDPLKEGRGRSFFWFARNYQDTALARMQYELCLETRTVSWMDLLYYDPGMVRNSNRREMALDNSIHGIDLMSLRSGWDKDAWFVSMHGGRNNANHGHLDAGSFDIQAMGEVWAYGNLGRDDYTFPGYFSKTTRPGYRDVDSPQSVPGRWHFYRLRAEGKNCLVINPGIRPDQNEEGAAKPVRQASTPSEGFFITDLTSPYDRDVIQYMRGIRLDRKHSVITVQDELELKSPSTIWWQMHTRASVSLSRDGRTATLKQKGKTLVARIVAPANGRFEVVDATYLPGRSFPLTKNSSNTGFRSLAIRLDGAGQTRIRVDFGGTGKKHRDRKAEGLEEWKTGE